jgi:hypothetical protein
MVSTSKGATQRNWQTQPKIIINYRNTKSINKNENFLKKKFREQELFICLVP